MPKPKRCKNCGDEFVPRKMGQKVCDLNCAIEWGRKERHREALQAQKKRDRAKKEELKSLRDHKAETQAIFNQYIRLRDHLQPCISCFQPSGTFQRHAGHYRTRAAAPQLSFNFLNVWGQCAQCNHSKSGNVTEFRINLVNRIGEARVQELENNSERAYFTVDYLKRFQKILKRRIKHYRRLRHV